MSLSVAGVIRIFDEPSENPIEGGVFFNFVAEGKDPKKKGGRFYYRVGLYVPAEKLEAAREDLKKGSSLLLRHGELHGQKSTKDTNVVFNQIKTSWQNVEPLVMTLRSDVQ